MNETSCGASNGIYLAFSILAKYILIPENIIQFFCMAADMGD